ncbi:MAG: altronate dehydratase [Clostridia bacterium]|nr:altronate dehydratase [Clostridia bacterium]
MLINQKDNVEINLENGHKYARTDIKCGEFVVKYGEVIGVAVQDIKKGEHVHSHNLKTNLKGKTEYTYTPAEIPYQIQNSDMTFMGYPRKNGDVGIRNDVWIINTVGCVNKTAEKLSKITGAKSFPHPYGCSQLGDDHQNTAKILANLAMHPNCGGVLVLGLGCENNNIEVFKKFLGDRENIEFLNVQDYDDEIKQGVKLIKKLKKNANKVKRVKTPVSKLKIGLKCGGSDGYSGITANPLVGELCDKLISLGGTAVLSEVPEMFGAEHILMNRAQNEDVFNKIVDLINNFKDYFVRHGQEIYENPSPGNKAGGITTLEEKSLGCIQKGGNAVVTDVLDYGETATKAGLNLLNGPGNDMVAVTNLAASGVHLILFTTGRGTPLGSVVPTIKISTNQKLAQKKSNWIDFDGSPFGQDKALCNKLFDFVIDTANGKKTKNEINGYEEIAIFKDGVTL